MCPEFVKKTVSESLPWHKDSALAAYIMVSRPKTARREKSAGFVNDHIQRPFTVITENAKKSPAIKEILHRGQTL